LVPAGCDGVLAVGVLDDVLWAVVDAVFWAIPALVNATANPLTRANVLILKKLFMQTPYQRKQNSPSSRLAGAIADCTIPS
jgi:hypothetical protein